MIATNLALSNFTTDFSVVSYHSSKSSSDFVVKRKFNSCWVGCKLLTSGFGGWSVPVGSGVVSYTSQWDYTTLHARTSFTTCPPTLTAGRRVCGPGGAGWLARTPARRVPAGDRLSVVGRSVRRGISISNHLYSSTHSCRRAPPGPPHPLSPADRRYFLLIYSQRRRTDSYHFYALFILLSAVGRNEEKQS